MSSSQSAVKTLFVGIVVIFAGSLFSRGAWGQCVGILCKRPVPQGLFFHAPLPGDKGVLLPHTAPRDPSFLWWNSPATDRLSPTQRMNLLDFETALNQALPAGASWNQKSTSEEIKAFIISLRQQSGNQPVRMPSFLGNAVRVLGRSRSEEVGFTVFRDAEGRLRSDVVPGSNLNVNPYDEARRQRGELIGGVVAHRHPLPKMAKSNSDVIYSSDALKAKFQLNMYSYEDVAAQILSGENISILSNVYGTYILVRPEDWPSYSASGIKNAWQESQNLNNALAGRWEQKFLEDDAFQGIPYEELRPFLQEIEEIPVQIFSEKIGMGLWYAPTGSDFYTPVPRRLP